MRKHGVTRARAEALHDALLKAGWGGRKIERRVVNAYLAQTTGMSLPGIRLTVDLGASLGLWRVLDRRPRPTFLLVTDPEAPEVLDGTVVVPLARE